MQFLTHIYTYFDKETSDSDACNCSDGEKVAIDQIIGGDDILSNHPGVWDATAAAEQPTSGGSNADEHLVPVGGNTLKSTYLQLLLCFHQLKSSSSDGTKILDIFEWTNNTAAVDKLWLQLKRSLREVPIVKRKSNGMSMMFLMPPRACELKELQKRCTKCFYYKEMEKFLQLVYRG
ncbi:hypothetical protein HID58_007802 [Brassica napus]|uniref:Uncharacterized protein n=1 Tax=Brassica napus TaxID=3708 RepID=A0ABQ8EIA6_BRANA|nr:hypothetical protein HID58_049041 [Brassica napus]KAH0905756.1 hypothetical protein HID58_037583 [Brassica napus]KAH0940341.1 hypothetical protein HID58_007802 [Brassica napus]